MIAYGADLLLDGVEVLDTLPRPAGGFGDGVIVFGVEEYGASAVIRNSAVRRSTRAGVTNFSGDVVLQGNVLDCNPIDLDAEYSGTLAPQFANEGDNQCGCGAAQTVCKVLSSDLEAPGRH